MSIDKCYQCSESERKVTALEWEILDMRFRRVTAFLLGTLAGIIVSFALMLGF